MKIKYCLIAILLIALKVSAQQIRPLTIADAVPGIEIKSIFNYPALASNLSVFKNRLLILDFMATNCLSCLKVLPRFTSLQQQYGDKIQIVLISNQPAEKVKTFLHQHAELKLPMVAADSVLSKLFPHTFISHEVWIRNGIVKAITQTEYVTNKNIDAVLADERISWPVKKDFPEFDYNNHLLIENDEHIPSGSIPENFYYATFSKYLENVSPKFIRSVDSSKKTARTLVINKPIIDLYLDCFGKESLSLSHIILKVKDSSGYIYHETYGYRNTWRREHTYCYEAILPFNMPAQQSCSKMIADLDFYLGMKGTMDTILTACYELHHTDTSIHLLSREASRAVAKQNGSMSLSIKELIYILNNTWYSIPGFNETGMFEKDYLNIPKNSSTDLLLLKNSIAKYGLQLIPVNRKAEMFVLQENSFKN